MPHPPLFGFSLRSFLVGGWRVEREIDDHRAGRTAQFEGEAVFTSADRALDYLETGHLSIDRQIHEASQRYHWTFPAYDCADVLFSDGRPFHSIALTWHSADTVHHCAPDDYAGLYRFDTPTQWYLTWRVTGPRKNYTSHSLYTRLHRSPQSLVSAGEI